MILKPEKFTNNDDLQSIASSKLTKGNLDMFKRNNKEGKGVKAGSFYSKGGESEYFKMRSTSMMSTTKD